MEARIKLYIKIWDTEKKECIATLYGHDNSIWSLVVLQNGYIVSGSQDKTMKIWNVEKKEAITTLSGHNHWIQSLTVLQNDYSVSGSYDTTIKICDVE